jgi:molybdopterin/thiamine biosynthesis adenylyltransferase
MHDSFDRYSRQVLFSPIGESGQNKLLKSSVLIVGMGALGTVLANHLVRAGVGFVRIVDRDYVEKSNLQRQMLYNEDDVEQMLPKAIAAKKKLTAINSTVKIEAIVGDVTLHNINDLTDDVDLVLDGTDNFETRFLLNDICFQKEIPFVYGGAVSSRGMTGIFIPKETPCLRCFISHSDQSGQTCDTIGVISPIIDIIASYQVTEALKYLVDDSKNQRRSLLTLDIWNNHRYEIQYKEPKKDCVSCQLKEFPALQPSEQENMTVLCGRDSVQIHYGVKLKLDEWAERLKKVATIQSTPFLVRAQLTEGERLVLFPDGRVLVQGTEDLTRAKTLYARYIGR